MKAHFYPTRNCYRVFIPAACSTDGKRRSLYFASLKEANAEIERRINQPASSHIVQTTFKEQSLLEECVEALGSEAELRKAVEHYQKTVVSVIKKGTVLEMCEAFLAYQKNQGFSRRTISDDRYRLKEFSRAFGGQRPIHLAPNKINEWINSWPLGANRRNMFKVAHKLMAWAKLNKYVGVDMMEGLKKPKAESAKDILSFGDFERIIRGCAGLDPLPELPKGFKPRSGLPIIQDFGPALPAFVLGGMVGLRTCEYVKIYGAEQTVQWEDVNWNRKWIMVRHGVAKKTRRDSDLRYPLLCDAAIAWLKPMAKPIGPIVELTDSIYREYRRQLCARLGIHIPTNGLRNSFASYGQSFRTLGEVAKDMGDLEETARKHYMQTLEPESGRAWFDIRPDAPAKILQMTG